MKGSKEDKIKSRLQLFMRIVISAGMMFWLITMIDWDETFQP